MKFWTILILAASSVLGACSSVVAVGVCPPAYKEYTRDEQTQAADELRGLQKENRAPTVRRFVVDYGALRAEVRELCK